MEVLFGEGFLEENLMSQLHFQQLGSHRVRVVYAAPVYNDKGLKALNAAVCLVTLVKMHRSVDPGSKGVIWTITVRLLEAAIFFSRVCYCLELNETPTSDMGEL